MGTKWSTVSTSTYADNSPTDDGAATEANRIKYATIRSDLTDPLDTAIDQIVSNLDALFDEGTVAKSGPYTTVASDHKKLLEVTGAQTITLLAAATAGAGYRVAIKSDASSTVTVSRSGTDTIDGQTSVSLGADSFAIFIVNAAGNGYISDFNDVFTSLSVDTINEKTSASGVTVDGVLLKDGGITATAASSLTATTGTALRVTNTGSGDSLLIEDSANPDSSPFVIDRNGRMVQGHTEYLMGGSAATFEQHSTNNYSNVGAPSASLASWSTNAAFAGGLTFDRSLSGVVGTETTVQNGTELGSIYWRGTDGSGFLQAAEILGGMDATPAGSGVDMPGRLSFRTTAVGSASPTERMRIDSAGNVGIGTTSPGVNLDVSGTYPTIRITDSDATAPNYFDMRHSNGATSLESHSGASYGTYTFRAKSSADPTGVERLHINATGNVGMGTTTPDGTLHVHSATAGTVTAASGADDLVVENSADGGISILTPDANNSYLGFGSPTDSFGAYLRWNYATALAKLSTATAGGELALGSADGVEAMRIDSAGLVGVGTATPTEKLDVNGDAIRVRTSQTPASASAAGDAGQICWDANYIYVCTATNTWKRSALATW